MRYLSDSWIEATSAALASATPLDTALSVGYVVTGGPEGERSYTMVYGPGQARCVAGVEHAAVTLSTDWVTAVSIAQDARSAQRAFLDGALKLDGDAVALLDSHDGIATFEPHLAAVRSATTFS